MRSLFLSAMMLATSAATLAQGTQSPSIFDGRNWGVVLDHPDTKRVIVKSDVTFLSDAKGSLKMDIYLPPDMKENEKRPAVIFLNGIGERENEMRVKSWEVYKSWPKLMAANGVIGISMENDGNRIQEGFSALFTFLASKGSEYRIDAQHLGVYAASANASTAMTYLMKPDAYPGIKAAVIYYGSYPQGPYRKDLPVMFVISEGDVRGDSYSTVWSEVMKNRAPWTVVMGSGLIHAFDSFNDNDDSRRLIKQTIAYWKDQLEPIPAHTRQNQFGREVLAALYSHNNVKAIELLKKYLETYPDDKDALLQYGSALVNEKRFADAEVPLKKGMALDPSNTFAQTSLVVVNYALDHPAEAEKMLDKLEKSGKMNRNIYANIGFALYTMGKHKEGVKFFEKIMGLSPQNVDYYNLACGYAILNEKDKAFAALEKAIAEGYDSKQQFENDADLTSLRTDKRYTQLLTKLK